MFYLMAQKAQLPKEQENPEWTDTISMDIDQTSALRALEDGLTQYVVHDGKVVRSVPEAIVFAEEYMCVTYAKLAWQKKATELLWKVCIQNDDHDEVLHYGEVAPIVILEDA